MSVTGLAPFGPTQLSAGMLATNLLAQNCPEGTKADKWTVLRNCITAKQRLNVSDRSLTVLSALLSFHQETELRAGDSLIVFPSNRALAQRAHGISEPTLRRALAQLVNAQLLVRRDSPNGKRYARRGAEGEITRVFGFDLTSLLAQAARIAQLAGQVEAERREIRDLREQVTLLRRDIQKSFDLAAAQGREGALNTLYAAYMAAPTPNMRSMSREDLMILVDALENLRTQTTKCLTKHIKQTKMNGNACQNERHKQDSNPNPIIESEGSGNHEFEGTFVPNDYRPAVVAKNGDKQPEVRVGHEVPLSSILEACPDIANYQTQPIGNWSEFIEAGKIARGALGISPSAWDEATMAMGLGEAAVTVATILQRQSEINSPGGYLRALSAKASVGKFTPKPIIQALLRRNLDQMAGVR